MDERGKIQKQIDQLDKESRPTYQARQQSYAVATSLLTSLVHGLGARYNIEQLARMFNELSDKVAEKLLKDNLDEEKNAQSEQGEQSEGENHSDPHPLH